MVEVPVAKLAIEPSERSEPGEVVPMPTLPAKYALSVVVAPPKTVNPPVCVPSPMVDEAVAMNEGTMRSELAKVNDASEARELVLSKYATWPALPEPDKPPRPPAESVAQPNCPLLQVSALELPLQLVSCAPKSLVVEAVPFTVSAPFMSAEPVLSMLKRVVVAPAVEEAMRKAYWLMSPLLSESESLAHGVEVPSPRLLPAKVRFAPLVILLPS